ncbi:MAG: hypothetical protein ACPG1C_07435 [Alphaproteobacteria bacterium]
MNKILRIVVALPGLLFLAMGAGWLLDPATAAEGLGMPLLEGVGLSTQIGDLAAFFVTLGVTILMGAATQNGTWLYAPAMLLGFAALFRIIAASAHGAVMATDMIGFEIIIAALLLFTARRFSKA